MRGMGGRQRHRDGSEKEREETKWRRNNGRRDEEMVTILT